MKKAIYAILILGLAASSSATIINIPGDYPTIQQGIDASNDGDTVLVQPGTYVENINFNGHNIVLGSLFLTTGDTSYISQTVIDGDSAGTVVTFESGEDSTALVSGITLRNGYADYGGGVFCENSNPVLSYNIISYNGSDSGGGGICCGVNSNADINNNSIIDNYAVNRGGGGIYCIGNSNTNIAENIIKHNTGYSGGGISSRSGTMLIENNIIYENISTGSGGGLWLFHSLVTLKNNLITDNTATYGAGGISCLDVSFVVIKNSIIWHNNSPENIEITESGYIFVTYSNVGGGWAGNGNIDVNPMFRNPENDDYHLMAIACGDSGNSPCIDAGDPEIFDRILDCQWGLGSDTSDIGGFSGGAPTTYIGRILHVPSQYGTIQSAIDAGFSRDTVLVQPGTYYETIEIHEKNIIIGSMYMMTGDPGYISTTIINGNNQNSVATFFNTEIGPAAIIGFTITRGNAQEHGGGIYCFNSSPLIKSNVIVDNEAMGYYDAPKYGGGICFRYYSNAITCDNLITGDTADIGGGIFVHFSNPLINNNIISNNLASDRWQFGWGGGMHIQGNPIVSNNVITYNEAKSDAGGVSSIYSIGGKFYNNIFHRNRSGARGCGMFIYDSDPILINNVFFENISLPWGGPHWGGGLYAFSSSSVLINNIFWNDSAGVENEIYSSQSSLSVSYCNIEGTLWPGEGNISVDPLFRTAGFHLQSTACGDDHDSPCIDAGDPNILDSLLDCSWGHGGLRSDMGAFGGGDSLITTIFDDLPSIPVNFMLLQNYPNPFNARTAIRFILPEPQEVKLTVYDLLGRQIEVLIDEYREAGVHTVSFDASSLSSGVYFYRLRAGDVVATKRMVLLK